MNERTNVGQRYSALQNVMDELELKLGVGIDPLA